MKNRIKVIYWAIMARLFPAYFKRAVQRDIDKICGIFMRESPVQKYLRERRSPPAYGGLERVLDEAADGINTVPRGDQ